MSEAKSTPSQKPSQALQDVRESDSPTSEKDATVVASSDLHALELIVDDASLELDEHELRRLKRIVDWRILPYCSLLYLLSFLDRVNIGQARLAGLEADLHLHGNQYAVALSVFFVSYVSFEVPSNLALRQFRPHRWITLIMVSWAIITTLMGVVSNYGGLVTTRFLLGLAEGGLYPGLNYVLSTWYVRTEMNWTIGIFFAGSTLAGAFGGILAFGIRHMAGVGGKDGWAWIFILEGLLTFLCAVPAWWLIPDFPEDGRVLKGLDQKRWLHRIAKSQGVTSMPTPFSWRQVKNAFVDWKLYVYSLMYIGIGTPFYSLALFTPSIIKALGFTNANANLLSVPPYVFGFITCLGAAALSDRFAQRGLFVGLGLVVTAVGYIILLTEVSIGVKYFAIFLCVGGVSPSVSTAITWISNNVGPVWTRAAAMGFFFGIGNSAGFISSNVYPTNEGPRFVKGHGITLALTIVALICCVVLSVVTRLENARRDRVYGPVAPDGSDASQHVKQDPEKLKRWGLEGLSDLQIVELGDRHPAFRYLP